MLTIRPGLEIPQREIQMEAIRAQGAGGQNVNKVSSAIHLRFDIEASSLPEPVKERLRSLTDSRITTDGIIVIKAQRYRTREKNTRDALQRLAEFIRRGTETRRKRIPTKPTRAARERRLKEKSQRAFTKQLRGKVGE